MTSLFVGIVTPTGKPRNPELFDSLSNFSNEVEMAGISAQNLKLKSTSKLSLPELACKMSHDLMYKKAAESHDWALIVEDDVQIDLMELERVWNLVQKSEISSPTIVSCYLGRWGVVKRSKNLRGALSCLYPPDGALCYFINYKAMKLALENFDNVKPADWPLWSRQVDFEIFPGVANELPNVISLIDPLQNRLIKSRNFKSRIKEFLGFAHFQTYGITLNAFISVWYWEYRQRLIWYFPALYHAKRSREFL